jgi:hypothetical protein
MLGYLGLALAVRSRNEWTGGCGVLRLLLIEEKEVRRPCTSSRLISSKCERSAGPIMSERASEWKDDDLEDLEFVKSGGEPGAPSRAGFDSAKVMVAISALGLDLVCSDGRTGDAFGLLVGENAGADKGGGCWRVLRGAAVGINE